ncbi:cell division protein FtsL [Salaquimonas pukyongi]|uniref:cell division protein FtsL n=1 Tax=Salaquimonas pukyongi TaxID=2712698 RepID=UPI0012EC2D6E|nr:hypothetical protein [Salaquimonas pukyongi]
MLRPVDLVMIGLLLGGAAFTFKVKQDSETAIDRVGELERAIEAEKDAIDVLKADWSLLTDPKRIARLVEQYADQLPISPPSPESIGTIADIPPRPAIPQSPRTKTIADLIEGQFVDTATTGSVDGPEDGQ